MMHFTWPREQLSDGLHGGSAFEDADDLTGRARGLGKDYCGVEV